MGGGGSGGGGGGGGGGGKGSIPFFSRRPLAVLESCVVYPTFFCLCVVAADCVVVQSPEVGGWAMVEGNHC